MLDHKSTQYGRDVPRQHGLGLTGPRQAAGHSFSPAQKRVQWRLADDKILLCQKHLVIIPGIEEREGNNTAAAAKKKTALSRVEGVAGWPGVWPSKV